MKRVLLAAFLVMAQPVLAEAADIRLWLVAPDPAGDLSHCPERARREVAARSPAARLLESAAELRWGGGTVELPGATADGAGLADRCFALAVNGRLVAAGATLRPYSARRLRFPVLQILPRRPGEGQVLRLAPQFPANEGAPVPPAWRDALTDKR